VDEALHRRVIAIAECRARQVGAPVDTRLIELDVGSTNIFLETGRAARARDGDDVLAAVKEPREGQLRRRTALLLGEALQAVGDRDVALEVAALEARVVAAPVVRLEVLELAETAAEEAAPQRAV